METFGSYVKAKRLEKNLSRSEMARRAGFTPQYAMDIERDNIVPNEDKIASLVNVLEANEKRAFQLANKVPLRIIEDAKRKYYAGEIN